MKRLLAVLIIITIALTGCTASNLSQIVATTLPVYEFTSYLCNGTGLTVHRLITQDIACLHDYTLQVSQTKALEKAELIVISGSGLENFLHDALTDESIIIDASGDQTISESHNQQNDHSHDHEHNHESDSHIWLSVSHAKEMCQNIYNGLTSNYPEHTETFKNNLALLNNRLNELAIYGENALSDIENRNIITFHDGFGYLTSEYGISIVKAIEEESGSEASAKELIDIIKMIDAYDVTAIFTEKNGSVSAANIIAKETGIPVYTLDMAISGDSWFDAMYYNIDTLKEALK